MSLLKDEERREKAASLKQYETVAANAVNRLKSVKSGLVGLKGVISDDVAGPALYYTSVDVADVQAVIDQVVVDIGTI